MRAQQARPQPSANATAHPWLPSAWALLVLVVGIAFTGMMAWREWKQEQASVNSLHRTLATAAQSRMDNLLGDAALSLRAMQTVFLSNDNMDQALFSHYQDNLRASELVPGHVLTGFAYRGLEDDGSVAYRYAFVAPLEGNEALVDYDIAGQPHNMQALERARDNDVPSVSAPFRLLQFEHMDDALGVTVRLPVYSRGPIPATVEERRRREIGALAISLRLEPMIREALEGRILRYMQVAIRDPEAETGTVQMDVPLDHPQLLVRHVEMGGRSWELLLWPRDVEAEGGNVAMILATGGAISLLLSLLMWSQATMHRRAVELGHRINARFSESEARFRVLNEMLPALVLLADVRSGSVIHANREARQVLGDVLGKPLRSLFDDAGAGGDVVSAAAGGEGCSGQEVVILSDERPPFWANVSLAQVDVEGTPCVLMVATDTSQQREMTEKLRYQAAHDELTGLYNRREFERRLRQRLAERVGKRDARPFALLYIDLDQFKLVNDISGHVAGDQLLVELAYAMRSELREGDLLARLGGDEFGLLAFDVNHAQAYAIAERMRAGIEGIRFLWQEHAYTVKASIGMVMVESEACTLKDLLAWADSACYQAKEDGRNRVRWYQEGEDAAHRHDEMAWTSRLRRALEQNRLLLDYQEMVALPRDGQARDAVHVELLLRMRGEDGNEVPPSAFLPAAERYGLMSMVDRWVIRTALANFDRLHPCGDRLDTCSINLSGASLEDDDLADFILDTIEQCGVPAQRVCLEITETVAVRNLARATRVIERLRAAGCRIALDDFGTGMSSFGYLKNLPVDIIKIDGSFIRDLGKDPMSRAIVSAVVQIARLRGLEVVAEWVDGEAALQVLHELGVDYAQGYLRHRPERVVFQRG